MGEGLHGSASTSFPKERLAGCSSGESSHLSLMTVIMVSCAMI